MAGLFEGEGCVAITLDALERLTAAATRVEAAKHELEQAREAWKHAIAEAEAAL